MMKCDVASSCEIGYRMKLETCVSLGAVDEL